MADIELVIKIDENIYRRLKSGNYGLSVSNTCAYEVLNGTPLPKEHGRLIDADKLIKWCESNDDKLMGEYYINHIVEELTIIEADKGDKE